MIKKSKEMEITRSPDIDKPSGRVCFPPPARTPMDRS